MKRLPSRPLTQIDAFFVAYQEKAGILMQLGVEIEVAGPISRDALERTLGYLTSRWPQLGQNLHRRIGGLAWRGECQLAKMLRISHGNETEAVAEWRNQLIDPFREPPFQLLAVLNPLRNTLAFRAHHAVADGAALFAVCEDAVRALAKILAGEDPFSLHPSMSPLIHKVSQRMRFPLSRIPGMWSHARHLAAEAGSGRSSRLSVRAQTPGNISTCEWNLSTQDLAQIGKRAIESHVTLPWLFAAAWIRTIGAWNCARSATSTGLVSLEVPVDLRAGKSGKHDVGNRISPLNLLGDPVRPLEEIAKDLLRQFRDGLRQCSHLAVPFFTSPARYLPWSLFRRLAVNNTSTGFATSHFAWLERKNDMYGEVSALSSGTLRLLAHHVYGPVCLHMGAALIVVVLPGSTKVSLTYRQTALDPREAEMLSSMVFTELTGQPAQLASFAR